MRLFLIIDETYFYQPDYVAELLEKTSHEVVGAALVTKVLPKNNIERYMIKNWYLLKPIEILKLGMKKVFFMFKNQFPKRSENPNFYSVRSVFKFFQVNYFEVAYDINKNEYVTKIKELQPDIIISSNSLIFKNDLLNIPKYCINRHSALLPAYGGLWPVFQAVRKGETKVGVSVHTMEKKIDKGVLLAQKIIPIQKGDSIDTLYQKCFKCSAEVVLEAIDKIEKNDLSPVKNSYVPSYYSFPKKEHWKQLRKRKVRFI